MPLKLASVNVDEHGDSYFGEVDALDGQGKERVQDVAYWQVWETKPGHFADFKPSEEPRCVAMMSGKLEITTSTGEKRYFARGDTFLLQDTSGKGHAVRTIGIENCTAMLITMKQKMMAAANGASDQREFSGSAEQRR
jgi:uncharacterized cupin superfamily protein